MKQGCGKIVNDSLKLSTITMWHYWYHCQNMVNFKPIILLSGNLS